MIRKRNEILTHDFFVHFFCVPLDGQQVSLDALPFENDEPLTVVEWRPLALVHIQEYVDVNLQLGHEDCEYLVSDLVGLLLHDETLLVLLCEILGGLLGLAGFGVLLTARIALVRFAQRVSFLRALVVLGTLDIRGALNLQAVLNGLSQFFLGIFKRV